MPGIVEAENYNWGGEGLAYHDLTPGNISGLHRNDDVDLVDAGDQGNYCVTDTQSGEWTSYEVNVASAGVYDIVLRVAREYDEQDRRVEGVLGSAYEGKTLRIEFNGVDKTGSITVPETEPNADGSQDWRTVVVNDVPLAQGVQTVKVVFEDRGIALDALLVRPSTTTDDGTSFSGSAFSVPGTIEAESFNLGGEGIAYQDSTRRNLGEVYRSQESVDVDKTTITSSGRAIEWTTAGEWTHYTVNVAQAGFHRIVLRVATPMADKTLRLEIDGQTVGGSIAIPTTGGWSRWRQIVLPSVSLPSGVQTLRVVMETGGVNLDWVRFDSLSNSGFNSSNSVSSRSSLRTASEMRAASEMGTLSASGTKYEAEQAALSGGVNVGQGHSGYSGTGFVDGYGSVGANTTFTVNAPTAGYRDVTVRYAKAQGGPNGSLTVYLNGSRVKRTILWANGDWATWNEVAESLNLQAGSNTISYRFDVGDLGGVNLDCVTIGSSLVSTPPAEPTNVYEAEFATLTGGAGVSSSHAGFNGAGFVDGYGGLGAKTTFTVTAELTGVYPVVMRYAKPINASSLSIYVNGTKIKQTQLPSSGSDWTSWSEKPESLALNAGINTIAYSYDAGDGGVVNLDGIRIDPPTSISGTKYEAEQAALSGGVNVSQGHSGYSGTGFVDGYGSVGANTTFTVNASIPGYRDVTLRYAKAQGGPNGSLTIYVNGTRIKRTILWANGTWATWNEVTEKLPLNGGSNIISYRFDAGDLGNVNLDCITLSGMTVAAPPAEPTNIYEAEFATRSGGAGVSNSHEGFSGAGYVDGYGSVGAKTTFSVDVPLGGSYPVVLRYAKPYSGTSLSIYVNGTKIRQTQLPSVGVEWDSWGEKTENLTLVAGANTIAYRYDAGDGGNANLDYIRLEGVASPPPNTSPVAVSQSLTTDEDVVKTITLSATDADNQPLTYTVTVPPTHGTLSGVAPDLTYTPNANYNGTDTFSFKANDGALDSNVASVGLIINPVNDAPVANAQNILTSKNTAKSGTLTATDVDHVSLTYSKVADPSHGTLSVASNGAFTYTPAANYSGSDSFTFKANDGSLDSNVATVTITIDNTNVAPIANSQSVTTDEDLAKAITITATDADNDTLTYSIVSPPSHGTLSGTAPNLTYTPSANYNGSDSFSFKANDGQVDSNVASVSIAINLINDAPVANPHSVTTDEDVAKVIALTATDVDNDTLTYSVVAQPTKGTLSGTAPNLTYTPNLNYNGSDTFSFKANDGQVNSNTATISLTITPANDAPDAEDDAAQVAQGGSVNIDVLANDTDVDGDVLQIVGTPSAAHGMIVKSGGVLQYTPTAGFSGVDTFSYSVTDNQGGTDTAQVAVTVSQSNSTPTLAGLSLAPNVVNGGGSIVGTVTLSGSAPAGGLVVTLSSNSSVSTVPASVTVPAGATSATFTVSTTTAAVPTSPIITATLNNISISQTLSINAPCVYF